MAGSKKIPRIERGGRKQICVGGVGGQICYEMVGQTCYNREEAQLRCWQPAAFAAWLQICCICIVAGAAGLYK
ncbi:MULTISPECIES: hypothetical protein [Geobacillus]|uniref:Uncharacterized protein n=1 Tax=Geobacillus stearothermophilus TaxID=1422 RepID=A0ABQ7HC03_GEOSE|nr:MULTISPECIES: hypothetical protein [Geobacillus]KAF6509725.1 hypothetical protein GS8_1882 [Geobacillus stearothermophilus]MED3769213.1 hypothetical protein [Geobacillus stearothermophilus]MED4979522.1 hypothetical protein [Geobacillus stearothermophilus]